MKRPLADRARAMRALLIPVLAVLCVFASGVGATSAAFTSKATGSARVSTAAACAGGTSYAALLSSAGWTPSLWWRFGNLTGQPTVADASGNGNTGTASGSGLSFGTANAGMVMCDTTDAMRTTGGAGATGAVVAGTPRTAPTTFTIATWVRTTALTGGRLVGFGSAASGASGSRDRALLLDRSGRPVLHLGTGTGNVLLTAPSAITDNVPHLIVASVSPTSARLYVDGTAVASTLLVAPPPTYSGYWRAGWETGVNLLITGSRNQANARQDEVAIWEGRALDATQVAALFAANHW
ncbi:MAG: LamG-like jellyroll fold domain-containing protein [Candidatus Nanopelagicales bacterium]